MARSDPEKMAQLINFLAEAHKPPPFSAIYLEPPPYDEKSSPLRQSFLAPPATGSLRRCQLHMQGVAAVMVSVVAEASGITVETSRVVASLPASAGMTTWQAGPASALPCQTSREAACTRGAKPRSTGASSRAWTTFRRCGRLFNAAIQRRRTTERAFFEARAATAA